MRKLLVPSLFLVLAAGCPSKKDEAPAAPSAPPVAAPPAPPPSSPTGAQDPAQAMAEMQKALGGLQNPGGSTVNWRQLVALLPDDLGGAKASGEAKGESAGIGTFQVSTAERDYKLGEARAHVKITDANLNKAMMAGFQMARMVHSDGSDHVEGPADIAGQPGHEKWSKGGSAEVVVLVAGRFLVEGRAGDQKDSAALRGMMGKLDLGKLAAMK